MKLPLPDRAIPVGFFLLGCVFFSGSAMSFANGPASAFALDTQTGTNAYSLILPDSGFIMYFTGGTNSDYAPQFVVFDDAGELVTGPVTVAPSSADYDQFAYAIHARPGGGFTVFWHRSIDASGVQQVMARNYSNAGVAVGNEYVVLERPSGFFRTIRVASNFAGTLCVVLEDFDGSLEAQIVDSLGGEVGSAVSLETDGNGSYAPSVIALETGNFRVAWSYGARAAPTMKVLSRQIAATGFAGTTAVHKEFNVPDLDTNPSNYFNFFLGDARLSTNENGDIILTYVFCNDLTHEHEVALVRFTSNTEFDAPVVVYSFDINGTFFSGLSNDGTVTLLGFTFISETDFNRTLYTVEVSPSNVADTPTVLLPTLASVSNPEFAHAERGYVATYQVGFGVSSALAGFSCLSSAGGGSTETPPLILSPSSGSTFLGLDNTPSLPIELAVVNRTLPADLTFTPQTVQAPAVRLRVNSWSDAVGIDGYSGYSLFNVSMPNPSISVPPNVTLLGDGIFADDLYTVSANVSNAISTVSNIRINTGTQPPVLTLPNGLQTLGDVLDFNFAIPEPALDDTVFIDFTPRGDSGEYVQLEVLCTSVGLSNPCEFSVVRTGSLLSPPEVVGVGGSSELLDGEYDVTLSYRDAFGGPLANATVSGVQLSTTSVIREPRILAPVNSSISSTASNLFISVQYDGQPSSTSLQLVPDDVREPTTELSVTGLQEDGTFSTTLNLPDLSVNLPGNLSIIEGGTVTDGEYTFFTILDGKTASTRLTIDLTTAPPVLTSPVMNSSYGDRIPFSFALGEPAKDGIVSLAFTPQDLQGEFVVIEALCDSTGLSDTCEFEYDRSRTATETPEIVSISSPTIFDGTYSVMLSYQDVHGNPSANVTVTDVSLSTSTPLTPPTWISPVDGDRIGGPTGMNVQFSFNGQPDFATLNFFNVSSGSLVSSVVITDLVEGETKGLNLSLPDLAENPPEGVFFETQNTVLADGPYDCELTIGSFSSTIRCTVDTLTEPATLIEPRAGFHYGPVIPISYELKEKPLGETARLTFTNQSDFSTYSLETRCSCLVDDSLEACDVGHACDFTWERSSEEENPNIVSKDFDTPPPDGLYFVSLSYQDTLGNPATEAFATNVTLSSSTIQVPPTVLLPVEGNRYGGTDGIPFDVRFSETPGSFFVDFAPVNSSISSTLLVSNVVAGEPRSFNILGGSLREDLPPGVTFFDGEDVLTGGELQVSIRGNSFLVSRGITVDLVSEPPTLVFPESETTYGLRLPVEFALQEPALNSTATLFFGPKTEGIEPVEIQIRCPFDSEGQVRCEFELDRLNNLNEDKNVVSASASTIPDGTYDVSLIFRDDLGNPAVNLTRTNVSLDSKLNPVSLAILKPEPDQVYSRATGLPLQFRYGPQIGSIAPLFLNETLGTQTQLVINGIGFNDSLFELDLPLNLSTFPSQVSLADGLLEDGRYTVSVNATETGESVSVSSFLIDTVTQPLVLNSSWINSSKVTGEMDFRFTAQEPTESNQVGVAFVNALTAQTDYQLTFDLSASNVLNTINFDWTLSEDPVATSNLVIADSGPGISDGNYNIVFFQRDVFGNPYTNQTVSNVGIQVAFPDIRTLTPRFIYPTDGRVIFNDLIVLPAFLEPMRSTRLDVRSLVAANASLSFSGLVHRDPLRIPVSTFQNEGFPQGAMSLTLTAADAVGNPPVNATIEVAVFWDLRDQNNNGLDDGWELRYFGRLGVDPNADPDGDGQTNLQEFLAGTDPLDPSSVLRITRVEGGSAIEICAQTVPGRTYQLQRATLSGGTLVWEDVGQPREATTDELCFEVTGAGLLQSTYFRIAAVEPSEE